MLDRSAYPMLIKAGILIAQRHPDKIEEVLRATTCVEIANILGFDGAETFNHANERMKYELDKARSG